MDLRENWPQIRATFEASIASCLHCAVATTSPDGYPHVTPIGHIFLRDDCTAYYFEAHTKQMPINLQRDPRVCLLLVNSQRRLWVRSLFAGRFRASPGMRLLGVAGERRPATAQERRAYAARVRPLRWTRGYQLIWKDLDQVREIRLERVEPVLYPVMTDGLWR